MFRSQQRQLRFERLDPELRRILFVPEARSREKIPLVPSLDNRVLLLDAALQRDDLLSGVIEFLFEQRL